MSTSSPTMDSESTSPLYSRRPQNTPFKQQVLPSVQVTMQPHVVISVLSMFGVLFIALGASITVDADGIQHIEMRYDDLQPCSWSDRQNRPGWACSPLLLNFTLTKTMPAPVFLYYNIDQFHQNNRRFVRSVSSTQLSGFSDYSASEQSDCAPFNTPSDFVDFAASPSNPTFVNLSDGTSLSLPNAVYFPCGLVPWSMYNDSMALYRKSSVDGSLELLCDGAAFDDLGNPLIPENARNCQKQGIGWASSAGVIYNHVPDLESHPTILTYAGWDAACQSVRVSGDTVAEQQEMSWAFYACKGWYLGEPGHRIPNPLDEDLWVWNRIASYSNFKKLYRRITVDLTPGTYTLQVLQRWDISTFAGSKSFVLQNTGFMGSRNYFLGGLLLAAGVLMMILAGTFLAKHLAQPPREFS